MLESSLTRKLTSACYRFLLVPLQCQKPPIAHVLKLIWSQVMETHIKPLRELHLLMESEEGVNNRAAGSVGCSWASEQDGTGDSGTPAFSFHLTSLFCRFLLSRCSPRSAHYRKHGQREVIALSLAALSILIFHPSIMPKRTFFDQLC